MPYLLLAMIPCFSFYRKLPEEGFYRCYLAFLVSPSLVESLQLSFHPHHSIQMTLAKITKDLHVEVNVNI